MPTAPPERTFGIKLVNPHHMAYPQHYDGVGGYTVMNFRPNPTGENLARTLPVGHRALVYVISHWKCFVWAIEFLDWEGDLEKVNRILKEHGGEVRESAPYNRPIKLLAQVFVPGGKRERKHGADLRWRGKRRMQHCYVSKAVYDRMYTEIPWVPSAT